MSLKHCPGIKNLIEPTQLTIRTCPSCGGEVEFFNGETEVQCPQCGRILHREVTPSCVTWCQYADKCIVDLKQRGLITPSRAEELEAIAKKKETSKEKS
ncbi:MAG: hypothetical protein QXJ75_06145 [Candidatus Bathyarchaeia archaeon]